MRPKGIEHIVVVGAGLMGAGIAQECFVNGYRVTLTSRSEESLEKGIGQIQANLSTLAETGAQSKGQSASAASDIVTTTSLRNAVSDADLVIEAIYENLALKQRVFKEMDEQAPDRTILASTSSSLIPSKIGALTHRPDRVLVTHYFNPPYLIPTVEVECGEKTSDETVATVSEFLIGMGKRPALVQKELPGFIAVRLQFALGREALSLVEQGAATPEDIDGILNSVLGRRWTTSGIFGFWDSAGCDLVADTAEQVFPTLESKTEVSPVLRQMVEDGHLGMKSGKGFYDWPPESVEATRRRNSSVLTEMEKLLSRLEDNQV